MEAPLETLKRAKILRRNLSLPEVLLWNALRRRSLGVKFRRQHPIGPFILDFFCSRLRLAVEIDGYSHGTGDRADRDARRDDWLSRQGIRVVRLSASTVLDDMDAALATIEAAAGEQGRYVPPLPASRGAPP